LATTAVILGHCNACAEIWTLGESGSEVPGNSGNVVLEKDGEYKLDR